MHFFRDRPDATITVDVDALHALRENSHAASFPPCANLRGGRRYSGFIFLPFSLPGGQEPGRMALQLSVVSSDILKLTGKTRARAGRLPTSLILSSGRPACATFIQ